VNLVARLESQCKELNTDIVAGGQFVANLSGFEVSKLEKHPGVAMKGFDIQDVFTWRNRAATVGGEV
jgi:class 3 adenylate cyclase